MITSTPPAEAAATLQRRADRSRTAATLLLLASAQFVVMLDTSIVNVAIPSIQADLRLTHTGAGWIVNVYFLAFGAFLLIGGRLADRIGRRRMLRIGAMVVTGATMLAASAQHEAVLLSARALQGLGAAALSPAALSLLLASFTGASRARAMSAWGAASTLGGASGVVLGGVVTSALGWPFVFLLTVPVTALALLFVPRLVPADHPSALVQRFDGLGAASISGAALALIAAGLAVPEAGLLSVPVAVGVAVAVLLLAVFLVVERRALDPIIPPALLALPGMSTGLMVGLLGGAARASSFFLVALLLQQVLRLEPDTAGLAMLPTSLAGFAVSVLLLAHVIRRLGAKCTVVLGLLTLAAGHAWLGVRPLGTEYLSGVLPGLLLVAAGVAFSFTPTTMLITSTLPSDRAGLAAGLSNASSQIGAAIGIAALTAVVQAVNATVLSTQDRLGHGFAAAFITAAAVALVAALLTALTPAPRS